ncbi:MAG TPA: cytosine permease [Actinocrinis sp.]|nr:cytosine permease [Actinocrinis sp.]
MTTEASPIVGATETRTGSYGTSITTVEPGGAEFIPLDERHGRPLNLFWTWTSPNFEFATVFVGIIPIIFFKETFTQAVLAIVLGTLLGSLAQAFLSARGPRYGVPQMMLSRISFGRFGNILPAGINSLVAGVGWFAVNSVSGALALNALTKWPQLLCLALISLVQIVVAFFGHNLVQSFEKFAFPVLAVIFLVVTVILISKAHTHIGPSYFGTGSGGTGGFLISLGATFGYAAGWNPYASDYTRYLKPDEKGAQVGAFAGLGVFLSCVVLEIGGAAAVAATPAADWFDNPTASYVGGVTHWLGDLALLAIALGAISANVLNVYSGALSFTTLGIKIPVSARRALVAAVFGVAGFLLAWSGLKDAGEKYNNFLLVIAYWIGPWLGVFFADQFLRRRQSVQELSALITDRKHNPWLGALAMALGMAISIPLFSNQSDFTGTLAKSHPALGDLTFEVGFVIAALVYLVGFRFLGSRPAAAESTDIPAAETI